MVGFEIPNNTPSPVPPKSATNLGKVMLPALILSVALVAGAVYFMAQGKISTDRMTSPLPTGSSSALPSNQ